MKGSETSTVESMEPFYGKPSYVEFPDAVGSLFPYNRPMIARLDDYYISAFANWNDPESPIYYLDENAGLWKRTALTVAANGGLFYELAYPVCQHIWRNYVFDKEYNKEESVTEIEHYRYAFQTLYSEREGIYATDKDEFQDWDVCIREFEMLSSFHNYANIEDFNGIVYLASYKDGYWSNN